MSVLDSIRVFVVSFLDKVHSLGKASVTQQYKYLNICTVTGFRRLRARFLGQEEFRIRTLHLQLIQVEIV